MRLRSLSLRTYLVLSYLILILLLLVGTAVVEDYATDVLLARSMETSQSALKEATADNVKAAEEILTKVGEYIIKDKAQDAARELALCAAKKGPYNYARLRRNEKIRRIAVQTIQTPRGPVGYTDLYDTKGRNHLPPGPGRRRAEPVVLPVRESRRRGAAETLLHRGRLGLLYFPG